MCACAQHIICRAQNLKVAYFNNTYTVYQKTDYQLVAATSSNLNQATKSNGSKIGQTDDDKCQSSTPKIKLPSSHFKDANFHLFGSGKCLDRSSSMDYGRSHVEGILETRSNASDCRSQLIRAGGRPTPCAKHPCTYIDHTHAVQWTTHKKTSISTL